MVGKKLNNFSIKVLHKFFPFYIGKLILYIAPISPRT